MINAQVTSFVFSTKLGGEKLEHMQREREREESDATPLCAQVGIHIKQGFHPLCSFQYMISFLNDFLSKPYLIYKLSWMHDHIMFALFYPTLPVFVQQIYAGSVIRFSFIHGVVTVDRACLNLCRQVLAIMVALAIHFWV